MTKVSIKDFSRLVPNGGDCFPVKIDLFSESLRSTQGAFAFKTCLALKGVRKRY